MLLYWDCEFGAHATEPQDLRWIYTLVRNQSGVTVKGIGIIGVRIRVGVPPA